MKDMRKWGIIMLAGGAFAACGQTNWLTNGGFGAGEKSPAGWGMPKAGGAWLETGGSGDGACVAVSGDGTTDGAWTSDPVDFLPGRVYRLSFIVRGEEAGGGTVVCGPSFANVDIGVPGKEWVQHENVFAAPLRKDMLTSPVRLGQWQLKGRAVFDDVRLSPVLPVHAAFGEGALGEGEKLEGNRYIFDAPFGSESRNHSRPLLGFTAHYNTERWCFGEGAAVTYRHDLAGRKLLSGAIEVNSGYFVSGRLMIDASLDAKEWEHVGVLTNTGGVKVELPAKMFPAEAVYVRLRGAKPPCSLQVHGYRFEGTVDGDPAMFAGSTRYIETESYRPRIRVQVRGLGEALPGGENLADLRVQNATGAPLTTEARVVFSRPGDVARTNAVAVAIPGAGAFDVRIPYEVPGVGMWQMEVSLGDAFTARSAIRVPEYYDDAYGEVIPVNNPKLNLWRASSGWKIPQFRGLPRQIAKSLALRVAKNEWEAVQLVVAPNEALTNLTVAVSDLTYGKGKIPAAQVSVLRVAYVPVTKKTDSTGTLAEWPDPLVPQGAPLTVGAGRSQPFWIRVKASKDTPAGIYRGTVTVQAEGVKVMTVLNVEVYDFALPDTLTCETAFGFSPQTVWRYHQVTEPSQRREVLDKYLRSLGEHRISPYNPAPMDGWSVTWTGQNPWHGGNVVTDEKAEGQGSLLVRDASEQQNVGASCQLPVALPEKGLKITFKHKTDQARKFLFSMNYLKADGAWMPGCNTDIAIEGKPEWQTFETVQTAFPKEAVSCRFTLWAAGYQEPGMATGSLWVDGLKVSDAASDKELVEGGAFEPVDINAVNPVFDWKSWDAAMERAFSEYRFNSFSMRVEGLGGGTFHERYEPSFLGYPESSPEYDLLFGKYLKGIEAHLKEKGWLDKAYVYWFDEPDPKDYAFVMNGFAKLKKHAPGLRRMLTEQVEKGLADGPNLWCPLTPSLNVAGLAERRAAGDQFWWYVCCGPKAPYATEFIDHPGTEMRVWLWQTWAERVTGILIWETVWWTSGTAYPDPASPQDPYRDPMSWVSGYGVAPGTKQPWGNGDGRFLYPPLAAADGKPAGPVLDAPVDSYRLELLRDGLEDYEYFVILKKLLAEKGAKLDPRTRENLTALLAVPADVSASLTSFTRDPATIETHRDKLARAIVELQKVPRP
ncbi:MAG TPA: DUF6067 family protein [Kiritimatiellia bacterium]|nr:DUF6067 family protein [Kiritimatiellia bacterium]